MQEQHHYYLAAAKVVFNDTAKEARGAMELNVMLRTENKFVTAFDIGRAQQIAQVNFFERVGDKTLEVVDVFLMSIGYIGRMSETQFQYRPKNDTPVDALVPQGVPTANDPYN